jgi:hypothetical protein
MEGRSITTLSDKPDPKKLTFDEWFLKKYRFPAATGDDSPVEFTADDLKIAWDAGQANK